MPDGDISSEWEDFAASVTHTTYYPLSWEDDRDGVSATRVLATVTSRHAGYACPDGHIFSDLSTVEATSGVPTTRRDKSEMHKDDKAEVKDLYGTDAQKNLWHELVRLDIAKSPDSSTYDKRKVYINPRWDLEFQLNEIRKGKTTKRVKKAR